MELQFKNEHILFAIESIWTNLDYRFKYLINQIVTANPIVLKEISANTSSWLDGLCYFVLSTNALLTAAATQAQITTEMTTVFPYFAKAWYGDIT